MFRKLKIQSRTKKQIRGFEMLKIRFDKHRRVVGWHGEIGLDAAEKTLDWIAANKNRNRKRKPKTAQNLAARAKAMQSINL